MRLCSSPAEICWQTRRRNKSMPHTQQCTAACITSCEGTGRQFHSLVWGKGRPPLSCVTVGGWPTAAQGFLPPSPPSCSGQMDRSCAQKSKARGVPSQVDGQASPVGQDAEPWEPSGKMRPAMKVLLHLADLDQWILRYSSCLWQMFLPNRAKPCTHTQRKTRMPPSNSWHLQVLSERL